jgi:hypothetical protein
MALVVVHGRFGRIVPLWLRCVTLGLAISWLVAVGHWLLVDTGIRPRPVFARSDADASGVSIIETAHRAVTGLPPHNADPPGGFNRYEAIAYGWPIANWGTVFRQRHVFVWQTGVDPIIAVDVRRIWPPADLPDPYRPALTKQQIASQCAAGACPPTNGTDVYQRYLPVFPLIGHSMVASVLYGLPFYVWLKRRDLRRRRGHCERCGYDRSGTRAGPCPECGSNPRSQETIGPIRRTTA